MRASRKLVVSFAFSTILCSGAAAEERLDLRVRRVDSEWVDQAEYLSPRLGVLSSAGDTGSLNRLVVWERGESERPVAWDLPAGAKLHLSRDHGIAAYWRLDPDGRQIITAIGELGEPVWEVSLASYRPFQILGRAEYVLLPIGSNMVLEPPASLEFHDPDGALTGTYELPEAVIYERSVSRSGQLGMIVGPRDLGSDSQFVLLSAEGEVLRSVDLEGCVGRGASTGMTLGGTQAAFVVFPGTEGKPVLTPIDRMVVVVPQHGQITIEDIGAKCGTKTAWLDDQRVALLGAREVSIWDNGERRWVIRDVLLPGESFLPEMALLDGAGITLARVAGVVHVVGIDLKAQKVILDHPLPRDAEIAHDRRTIYRDPRGLVIVTKHAKFLVEKEAGR